jgi:hypothetical protein
LVPGPDRHGITIVSAAVAAAAGLLTLGLVGWDLTRPPPPDPLIRVGVLPVTESGSHPPLLGDLYSPASPVPAAEADYLVIAQTPGDVITVSGVTGPGLAHSSAAPTRVTFSDRAVVTMTAAMDCAQPHWWSATNQQYAVRVQRVDAWGRSATGTVALPVTEQTAWREVVQRQCMTALLAQAAVDNWSVTADRRRQRVQLSMRVRNPASHPIFVQLDFPRGADSPPEVQIPPGDTRVVSTGWGVGACAGFRTGLLALLGSDDDDDDLILVRAGPYALDPPLDSDRLDPNQTVIPLPHAVRLRLVAELDDACAEATSPT